MYSDYLKISSGFLKHIWSNTIKCACVLYLSMEETLWSQYSLNDSGSSKSTARDSWFHSKCFVSSLDMINDKHNPKTKFSPGAPFTNMV